MLPLFLKLTGRDVLLVGGGRVAASKLGQLVAAGACVHVVAPHIAPEIEQVPGVSIDERPFVPADLDGVWLAVAAATPEVNQAVAAAAERRRVFVNAVDDPQNASAYMGGVVRRDGVTIAVSTGGEAPALSALVKEAIDAALPAEVGDWLAEARRQRVVWKRDGVPIDERKPRLREWIEGRAETPRDDGASRVAHDGNTGSGVAHRLSPAPGFVSLVGAGPGDPGLLTRTAIARLRAADLVLFDALLDDRILRYARHAQRFFVGKRAGRHAMSQAATNGLMIRAARRGRRVVRLKGGDPFVFGRGGEELHALVRAGIACEVVPGVSSAFAAPALEGIPLTHRGLASAFHVVSGHDPVAFKSAVERLAPEGVTLLILMGIANASDLAGVLMAGGWSPATPAAVIFNASRPGQYAWRGSVGDLAAGGAVAGEGPGTIVVGAVAAFGLEAGHAEERKYGNG